MSTTYSFFKKSYLFTYLLEREHASEGRERERSRCPDDPILHPLTITGVQIRSQALDQLSHMDTPATYSSTAKTAYIYTQHVYVEKKRGKDNTNVVKC